MDIILTIQTKDNRLMGFNILFKYHDRFSYMWTFWLHNPWFCAFYIDMLNQGSNFGLEQLQIAFACSSMLESFTKKYSFVLSSNSIFYLSSICRMSAFCLLEMFSFMCNEFCMLMCNAHWSDLRRLEKVFFLLTLLNCWNWSFVFSYIKCAMGVAFQQAIDNQDIFTMFTEIWLPCFLQG